jgi:hypothetical protein
LLRAFPADKFGMNISDSLNPVLNTDIVPKARASWRRRLITDQSEMMFGLRERQAAPFEDGEWCDKVQTPDIQGWITNAADRLESFKLGDFRRKPSFPCEIEISRANIKKPQWV